MTDPQISEKLDKLNETLDLVVALNLKISEQNNQLIELNNKLLEKDRIISERDQTVADQKETIAYLKNKLYGRKSEKSKYYDVPGQLDIFDMFGFDKSEETEADKETEHETITYTRSKKKKKATSEEMYRNLPVEKKVIPVADKDRICPCCGKKMIHLGEKFARHEIGITPAKVNHYEIYQETVICEECKNNDAPSIVEAQMPEPLVSHSPMNASAVAYMIYMKYVNSIPLYRQEKEWMRMGLKVPRATMASLVITCADKYLRPLSERLRDEMMLRLVICADETPCQVLKENDKTPQSKSYMWLYCTVDDGKPAIAIYDYNPGRNGDYAVEFLKGFKGKYIVCDGYQGYNKLPDSIIRCGCLAHVRRKWADAIPPDRRKRKPDGKAVPAEIGFDFCNRLFEMERKFRESENPEESRKIRTKTEPRIWKEFWSWLDTIQASGGSRLGKAVNYTLNQKPVLMNYLKDDSIPISNNFAENCARPYAVGRKNFLFHNSVEGADTSAVIYSVVESAKRNGLNVLDYLTEVMDAMRGCEDVSAIIDDLLPWSERVQRACNPQYKEKEAELQK